MKTGNNGIAAARGGVLLGLALWVGLGVAVPGLVRTVVAGGPARAQAQAAPAVVKGRQDTPGAPAGLVVPFGLGEPGRYALTVTPAVLSANGNTTVSPEVYLLNSQTGQVWKLRSGVWAELASPPVPLSITLPQK